MLYMCMYDKDRVLRAKSPVTCYSEITLEDWVKFVKFEMVEVVKNEARR